MKRLEELLPDVFRDMQSGTPPIRWECGMPIDLEPQRVITLAGAPGSGKTALAVQLLTDALRANPDLSALIVNVEMSPRDLIERQAARIGGVPLKRIRDRQLLEGDRPKLATAREELESVASRLAFGEGFDLAAIARDADELEAEIVLIDYVQRIRPAVARDGDRANLDSLIDGSRRMATAGACVILVSAVARQRNKNGRASYQELDLASFRGSSEMEFGVDSAYILEAAKDDGATTLRCVKNRHGELLDLPLRFRPCYQRFEPVDPLPATTAPPPAAEFDFIAAWNEGAADDTE